MRDHHAQTKAMLLRFSPATKPPARHDRSSPTTTQKVAAPKQPPRQLQLLMHVLQPRTPENHAQFPLAISPLYERRFPVAMAMLLSDSSSPRCSSTSFFTCHPHARPSPTCHQLLHQRLGSSFPMQLPTSIMLGTPPSMVNSSYQPRLQLFSSLPRKRHQLLAFAAAGSCYFSCWPCPRPPLFGFK